MLASKFKIALTPALSQNTGRGDKSALGILGKTLASAAMAVLIISCKRERPPPPATRPTTKPATLPATKPATTQYTDVLREHYPKFPATQPLDITVDLKDAGHYILPEPIYICPRGDLWITRPDAPPTPEVLKTANDQQVHLTRERVRYVQWSVDDEGKPVTRMVIDAVSGQEAWVDGDHSFPTKIGHYRWDAALAFNNTIVVPSARGVSIFAFTAANADGDPPKITETYQETVKTPDANPPQILLDPRGVIAWSPCDDHKSAATGAWRFADEKWTDLSADPNWSAKFIHLVPLLDGSVLQLIRKDDGKLSLALSPLDTPQLDETALNQLIDQLSDDDPDKRNAAYAQLTRYGPASWPILEKKLNDQPPEAQMRMQQLLRNRIQPTLGGRSLVDGTAKVVSRFDDGGILLHTAAGVSIPKQDKPPEIVKPAWISIRPGMAIELLDPVLVKDADPAKQHVFAFDNEWIIADPVQGPRRLFGNHLEPMLNKDESTFTTVIGYDRRGRWLFRKSPDAKETLILDPTLPDLTPRLPVWLMAVDQGSTGWTNTNWPAIKRGGAWALSESGWRPLDEKKEPMLTQLPPQPHPIAKPRQSAAVLRAAPPPDTTQPDGTSRTPSTTRTDAPQQQAQQHQQPKHPTAPPSSQITKEENGSTATNPSS